MEDHIMKKLLMLVIVVVACLVIASNGRADIRSGDIEVSPFFGGYTFDNDLSLKTGTAIGLRLGKDITKRWGIEGVYDYVSAKQENTIYKVRANGFRLEALYHFMPDQALVPFLAVGGGGTKRSVYPWRWNSTAARPTSSHSTMIASRRSPIS
jgi:OOP family OmpA-OmpF porin